MQRRKYKVPVIKEGGLGTLFLGSSKLPAEKIEAVLNKRRQGRLGDEFHGHRTATVPPVLDKGSRDRYLVQDDVNDPWGSPFPS
jgi:hypothetical protein